MSSRSFAQLASTLQDLEQARGRIETAHTGPASAATDVLIAYEGLFLRLMTSLETYIESYFSELLGQRYVSPAANYKTLVSFHDSSVQDNVIFQNKNYIEWLPYDRTAEIAAIYLQDGVPFSLATAGQRGEVKTMCRIRNAIAHSSEHSSKEFTDKVIGTVSLPSQEQTPAGYLRGAYRSSPRATRFELFIQQVLKLAQTIDP